MRVKPSMRVVKVTSLGGTPASSIFRSTAKPSCGASQAGASLRPLSKGQDMLEQAVPDTIVCSMNRAEKAAYAWNVLSRLVQDREHVQCSFGHCSCEHQT